MASIIKTDNIQTTGGANIINQCSTTITLGASGDSVVLGAGATATGFGRSGGVNYCTTAKTTPFTAANGSGYFVNTTCGAITVTLPASPSAGAIIALKDYSDTWQTNNVTVCNNGSKINGVCATATLNTKGQSVTLIYVDATKGWQDINDSTSNVNSAEFITATGGTILTCGDYKTHIFTSDGTFCVSSAGNVAGSNTVNYTVVAGGGGGGGRDGGGGGAGGLRLGSSLPVTATGYPITVGGGGGGGTACSSKGTDGSNSIFSSVTSTGGGGAGSFSSPPGPLNPGNPGGSGGGGGSTGSPGGVVPGGSGNTPPVSPPQGNSGGAGFLQGGASVYPNGALPGGGGGGASAVGEDYNGPGVNTLGAGGGNGLDVSPYFPGFTLPNSGIYAGGGGAGAYEGSPSTMLGGNGGTGGGGPGGNTPTNPGYPSPGAAGSTNTGGGGGGGSDGSPGPSTQGGAGGSGIVIIRYKFQ